MNKRKTLIIVLLLSFLLMSLFGTSNHLSVPLNHRAYSVLKVGEMRGIISTKMDVRPYNISTVVNYLTNMINSDSLSKDERLIVKELIAEFTDSQEDNSFTSLAKYGSYETYFEQVDTTAKMGFKFDTEYANSLNNLKNFDSRNGIKAYLQGHIKDLVSFNMDFGFRADHIDYRLFMKNDVTIPSNGDYISLFGHDEKHLFYFGTYAHPELSFSFLNDNLNIRWASITRDWGVGENNLMLSGSASEINAIELNYQITPWLKYAFITGALGKFSGKDSLYEVPGKHDEPSEEYLYYKEYLLSDELHDNAYMNNYTAHRVEVQFPFNIKFGIYESVVYRKRFEIGYLNPLAILMFEQDMMGDFDNMLAGIDLQYTLKNYFRIYGTMATTEMNEIQPSRFFKSPRNVYAIQAGADINIPFVSFSSATVQYTYLSPFFYAHKPITEGNTYELVGELSMVNKGRNIGYPLRPNSDEILVKVNLNFKNNWDGSFTFKYQRRSGQYGFNMDKWLYYTAFDKGVYEDKKFSSYIFEKSIGLEANVNKKLNNYPIKISASYILSLNNQRENPVPVKVWNRTKYDEEDYNNSKHENYNAYPVYKYKVEGPWEGWKLSHTLKLGVNIWL